MTRTRRWLAGIAIALALLAGGAFLALRQWLPNDEALAAEVATRFEAATGIGLRVGRAHWALRPIPVIVLGDIATVQPRPITVGRLVIHPRLAGLWRRELAIESVEIENAAFPRASVREFRGRLEKERAGGDLGSGWTLAPIPLERLRFRRVEWFDRRDIALSYDGDIAFDPHWRPREAELSRSEIEPPARLRLRRDGEEDRWRVDIDVAGGTWNGEASLDARPNGPLRLSARLAPRNVDVALLVAGFKRRSAVEGKLNGETSLDSEGATALDLVRRLHTRTRFDIHPATLKGFDLARAVQTAGTERAGSTPLDELSGTLDTQAGDDGVRLRYTGLKARSGVLTATGSATVFNRRLEGEASVDLIDDVLGVPFKLSGTLDKPELSMTRSAMAGAAIGTAVLPGVGTALGARLGERIGRLFDGPSDGGKASRRKAAPAAP